MTKCLICHKGKNLPVWANVHGECYDQECHCNLLDFDEFAYCKIHNKKGSAL